MIAPESAKANPMRWHVVFTKPRQEMIALAQLEHQGYACYLPLRAVEKVCRGRRTPTTEPLFPRYLFIHLGSGPDAPSWGPIRSTLGVSHLVRFGNEAACVADTLIDQLRRCEQIMSGRPAPLYEPGDCVRINEGPYAGLSAVYQMVDGDARARVLITLLQRPAQLMVPLANLRRDAA